MLISLSGDFTILAFEGFLIIDNRLKYVYLKNSAYKTYD